MVLLEWGAIALVLAIVTVAALGVFRLRTLTRRIGSFDCGIRPVDAAGQWEQGIAHYGVTRIAWWRCWSLSMRPAMLLDRSELVITGRRPLRPEDVDGAGADGGPPVGVPTPAIPAGVEALTGVHASARADAYIVRCSCRGAELELAMSAAAYAGLASWLEAAPPTRRQAIV